MSGGDSSSIAELTGLVGAAEALASQSLFAFERSVGDRIQLYEQGSLHQMQAHEAEFVARVHREDSEREAEMRHVLVQYRDEAAAQRLQADRYARELQAAAEDRLRLVQQAEDSFHKQEAAILSSRSVLTAET